MSLKNALRAIVVLVTAVTAMTNSVAAPTDAETLEQRVNHLYRDAATYQGSGMLLVIQRLPSGKRRAETFETFEVNFDRKKGIKASEHRHSSGGFTSDHTAWGPLDAIQSYREDRVQNFLVHVETRSPTQRPDGFGEFFTGGSNTPGVWLTAGLLTDGQLFPAKGSQPQISIETDHDTTVLVHRTGQSTSALERRLTISPEGRITQVHVTDGGGTELTLRFNRQIFEGPVAATDLAFALPDYAPAFNQTAGLNADDKKALMEKLAQAGNRDAQVRVLLADYSKSTTPGAEAFTDKVTQLEKAESLGFAYAYVLHGQLFQADNRNWFPPDIAQLSDDAIRQKQRGIFLDGADHCSGEAELALRKTANPPLTTDEEARLKKSEVTCWTRFSPPELQQAQVTLDKESKAP